MSFFDQVGKTLKSALDTAKSKGEEATQYGKLRYELFDLGRKLDAQFIKLGKSVYAGENIGNLTTVTAEIRSLEAEMESREQKLRELQEKDPEMAARVEKEEQNTHPDR